MVGEVIARTIENLFSWTTLIGIAVFTALNLIKLAPALFLSSDSEVDDQSSSFGNGCVWMLLAAFFEAFAVFYLVVAISPKVLGFDTEAQWLLPLAVLGLSPWLAFKRIATGYIMAIAASFLPMVGRLQIFLYTAMSIVFYRVGYKWSRPDGYRIGNEAYKDFIPDFSVSLLIVGTCIALSVFSILLGVLIMKRKFFDEAYAQLYGMIGAAIFGIIPIYMYGAWFSLKMH